MKLSVIVLIVAGAAMAQTPKPKVDKPYSVLGKIVFYPSAPIPTQTFEDHISKDGTYTATFHASDKNWKCYISSTFPPVSLTTSPDSVTIVCVDTAKKVNEANK